MAHDVFISYSTKDKPTADAACAALEAKGIRCWIAPRDILPGSDWGEAIIDGHIPEKSSKSSRRRVSSGAGNGPITISCTLNTGRNCW